MAIYLSLAAGPDAISVRHFSVSEALSTLFDVSVVAVSPLDDIDFESIVGQEATLQVEAGELEAVGHSRTWTGVCCHFEQLKAEETGLSTYLVRIVPKLWLASQRTNRRIFQHASTPEIVKVVLSHWKIEPVLRFEHESYPKHEYRVQYDESDLAFVSRLLEEAGITYYFEHDPKKGTQVVLTDEPHRRDPSASRPIPFVDQPNPEARKAYLTNVTASRELRPGAYAIRDYDFRRKHDVELAGKSNTGKGLEAQLEQYRYDHGSFVIEGSGGQGGGDAHADEKHGQTLATVALQAERALTEIIGFETNLVDLSPGVAFQMSGHPRAALAPPARLLAIELQIEGTEGAEWLVRGRAIPASTHWRPTHVTRRPEARGVESAVVVGPEGEEIHTDSFGRVKLQFHWDRVGKHNDHSSCWVRVSQGWAGAGYGMIALPRIGQEVLVSFWEGNPDQPVVVGRVYNNKNPVPYKLPDHKTKTAWKSRSSPHSDGFNEITMEDRAGRELLFIQAQKDLSKLVKHNEEERTGANRTMIVGANRSSIVGAVDGTLVGAKYSVVMATPKELHIAKMGSPEVEAKKTSIEMSEDKITLTTGKATVEIDGAKITLKADGDIKLSAGGDVVIHGGPFVKINC